MGVVVDLWSSYSLDQLDYMSLPQGHPLFIRREKLRQQKQHDDNINEAQPDEVAQPPDAVKEGKQTQPGEVEQLLYDPLEEATLREERAQFWEDLRQQKLRRENDEVAQQFKVSQIPEPHDDDREPVPDRQSES